MFKKAIIDFDLLNCKVYNIGNSLTDVVAGQKARLKNNILISNINKTTFNTRYGYYETNYQNLPNLIK